MTEMTAEDLTMDVAELRARRIGFRAGVWLRVADLLVFHRDDRQSTSPTSIATSRASYSSTWSISPVESSLHR
jgi:hypothetical protein